MAVKRGKFIVIEGGDGSGKSTAIEHLKTVFAGQRILFTREPGGTSLGFSIRKILMEAKMDAVTELLLFCADRREHLETVVLPALKRGTHVICDRFDASTYAYQVYARGEGKNKKFFDTLNAEITKNARPDCYIFFDVPARIAMARMRARTGAPTRFDKEKEEFHQSVTRGYKTFLKNVPHVIVDATVDIPAMEKIIKKVVRGVLSA